MKIVSSLSLCIIGFSLLLSSCLNTESDTTVSFEQQWAKDTTSIGVHLRAKSINALKDVSGVRFVIDSLAKGFPPKNASTVTFTYKGTFLSGTAFDQGTITGAVNSFIPGFQIALQLMTKGSKARFFIPSGYAYGVNGSGSIPPNSNLIFEIFLKDVAVSEVEKQQLKTDTVAIDSYLSTNAINAVRDKSGLRYVVTQVGTGAVPGLYDKVKITFTGKVLANGSVFFAGTSQPTANLDSRVIGYIYAFQVGLLKLKVGSKATFYVPSGLGFGNQSQTGSVSVPANSNLIYEIELDAIVK